MVAMRFTVEGLEKTLESYQRAPEIVDKELRIAMLKSTLKLKAKAKEEAPTGATKVLAESIYSTVHGSGYVIEGEVGVGPGAPYGICVQTGTVPHMPPIAAIRLWAERKLGNAELAWPIAMSIKKKGTKANPFFTRAWESEQENINAFFEAANENVANQIASGSK